MFLQNILLNYDYRNFSISPFTAFFQNYNFKFIYDILEYFLRSQAEVTNITNTSLSFTSLPIHKFYKLSISYIFRSGSVHFLYFPISQECRFKWNWFSVVDNTAEPFYLTNLGWFHKSENKYSLCVISASLITSWSISTFDYVSVSALMQRQNAMWLRLLRWLWLLVCGGNSLFERRKLRGLSYFEFVVCCLLLVSSVSRWSLVRNSPTECVCV